MVLQRLELGLPCLSESRPAGTVCVVAPESEAELRELKPFIKRYDRQAEGKEFPLYIQAKVQMAYNTENSIKPGKEKMDQNISATMGEAREEDWRDN